MTPQELKPILDVDRIVADLQTRVAARRAAGEYDERVLRTRFELSEGSVVLRPHLAFSSKPIVGAPLTATKRLLIRLQIHFLNDIVAQTNAALASSRAALEAESERRTSLEERVEALEKRVTQLSDSSPEDATRS